MEGGAQRENGRYKLDQYKGIHTQWMIPPHLMKDPHALSIKFMTIVTERDTAFQERDLALSEKKTALAERDMAIMQRDAAISERNNALMERDNVFAAFGYRENATINGSSGVKHMHHLQPVHHSHHTAEATHHTREMHVADGLPISAIKPRRGKRLKETNAVLPKKVSKSPKKGNRGDEDLNKQIMVTKPLEWKSELRMGGSGEDLNKLMVASKPGWKNQDLGLNQVSFDDSAMPVPTCSCTGIPKQCYKWGNGGWQSACCTTTLSMYPLPVMPNKRHARIGGRKMSGSVFTKLLSRLAAEGHDLSNPLDLKDHWAKHGTNRYITIK